jgi:hypothetical protein
MVLLRLYYKTQAKQTALKDGSSLTIFAMLSGLPDKIFPFLALKSNPIKFAI